MTKEQAIQHFGSQQRLAEVLGLKQPTISAWKRVPDRHQHYLERLTDGKLRADPHPMDEKTPS